MFEVIKAAAYVCALSSVGALTFYFCITPDIRKRIGQTVVLLAFFIPVISFLSPNLIFYNLATMLIVPVFAQRRELIAPVYLFSYVSLPLVDVLLSTGGFYLVTYNASISLGFGALIALMLRSGKSPPLSTVQHLPFLIFLAIFVFASARDTSFTNLFRVLLDLVFLLAFPYFIMCQSIRNISDFKLALVGLGAATVILSVVASYEALRAWPLYRLIWNHYGVELARGYSVKLRGGLLRAPGPFPEPTSFAYCLALGLVALYAAKDLTRTSATRGLLIAITLCGMLAPQSRGAWTGAFAGILALDAFRGRWSSVGRTVGLTVAAGIVLVAASATNNRIASFTGMTAEGRGTVDYRKQLLDRGLEEVGKAPLLGESPPRVIAKLRDVTQGEGIVDFVNAYLYIALVSGLIGLFLIVIAWGAHIYTGWHQRHRYRSRGADLSSAAFGFAAMASILLMLFGTSISGRNAGMIAIAMGFITALSSGRERSAKPAAPFVAEAAVAAA